MTLENSQKQTNPEQSWQDGIDWYYRDDEAGIYIACGDCRQVLPQLGVKVDLTFTSPPFNLGNTHHTGNRRHQAYSDNLPETEYQSQQEIVLNELFNITKDSGSCWYQHKNRIKNGVSITPYEWLLRTKWTIKEEVVWRNRSQNFDKIRFYPMTERLYWLAKSPKTVLNNKVNLHDDWHIEPVGSKEEHTRAFPTKIVDNVLRCFDDADLVLDPFLGSGTTALACKILGRRCIGIEIEEKYCQIAVERLRQLLEKRNRDLEDENKRLRQSVMKL